MNPTSWWMCASLAVGATVLVVVALDLPLLSLRTTEPLDREVLEYWRNRSVRKMEFGVYSGVGRPAAGGADEDSEGKGNPVATASRGEQEILLGINPLNAGPAAVDHCPRFRKPSGKSADGKSTNEHIAKYTRYVFQYCNISGMLQMHMSLTMFIHFMDKIATLVKLQKGFRILDWGCGCGTMLNYFHTKYSTTGVGIDVTAAAIEHARAHRQPNQTFCLMDGSDLRFFETDSFDAIVSWAGLYHIRRTLVQCNIVHQMIRILRPGGVAFIGHLRTEKTQEYWRKKNKCLPPNATLIRYRDYKMFNVPSFRRHQFFSIVAYKQS